MNPWSPVHHFILITTFIHHFSSSLPYWSLFIFHLFHYTINHFVFYETGKIDNLSAVGDKVFLLSVCKSASIEGKAPEIFNIHLVVDFKVLLVRYTSVR